MVTTADPVATGLVDSLARPGGNITGVTRITRDLNGKRLELLKEVVSPRARIGVLVPEDSQAALFISKIMRAAARALKIELQSLGIQGQKLDFESAFQTAAKGRVSGLVTITNGLINVNRKKIVDLALKHRLPSMYELSGWAEAGGLMSYSADDLTSFGAPRPTWIRFLKAPSRRSPSRATDEIRVSDQPENSQTDWPYDSANGARASGSGDQMKIGMRLEATGNSKTINVFCFALYALLFALCVPVDAQQPAKTAKIGELLFRDRTDLGSAREVFRRTLRDLGYVEGKNIALNVDPQKVIRNGSPLADELVRLKVDVLVASSNVKPVAFKNATRTIPIVFYTGVILLR